MVGTAIVLTVVADIPSERPDGTKDVETSLIPNSRKGRGGLSGGNGNSVVVIPTGEAVCHKYKRTLVV